MKSRWVNSAFFLFGAGVFVYLISRFGVGRIMENLARAGWSLLAVVLLWLVIYLLNTLSWKLVLGASGRRVPLTQLFLANVSGFVLNYITPFLALGGEPYKVKALSGALGAQRSLSAVVLYRMVHLLGHMLLLLAGIALTLVALRLPPAIVTTLALSAVAILVLAGVTLLGHRQGVFLPLRHGVGKIGILRPLARLLARYEGNLREMDEVLTEVYRNDRKTFAVAVLLEFLSRICMAAEVYLILRGLGAGTGFTAALFVYVIQSIVINVLFFIPLNLGAREGGLYLALGSVAQNPFLGISLGVVMRIREFVWILIGLLLIPLASRMYPLSAVSPVEELPPPRLPAGGAQP